MNLGTYKYLDDGALEGQYGGCVGLIVMRLAWSSFAFCCMGGGVTGHLIVVC